MNDDIKTQITSSINIADLIGERVKLRPSSRGFVGLCPFHNEDTPSFHVYVDTQSYYCYGCHEAGDIFTYVMKTEGLNFREALENLASRAGVSLSHYEARPRTNIMDTVTQYYTQNLLGDYGAVPQAYIQRRKLDSNDVTRFSLGYSLPSWDALVKYLRASKIPDKTFLDLGLALHGKRDIYDRFRGRLMFPIRDVSGKVIAFGGRLIDGDGAKYMNSPESEIYSKRKNLYLLNQAKASIREKQRSILVEGYMDAIRLHKCGFTESVASLGTSLTETQAELLSRFAEQCYICYDSDSAGQAATIRGMYILQEHGLNVKVVRIPEGKDPDEFLINNEPALFEQALQSAKPLISAHIELLTPSLNNPATRKTALKELNEGLVKLSPDEVIAHKNEISIATLIPPGQIDQLYSQKKQNSKRIFHDDHETFSSEMLEAAICAMLFRYSECRLSVEPSEILRLLKSPIARETAAALLENDPESLKSLWLSIGETEKLKFLAQGENFCSKATGLDVMSKWQSYQDDLKNIRRKSMVSNSLSILQQGHADLQDVYETLKAYHDKSQDI